MAAVMLQAVGDDKIIHVEHHIVTRNLCKYLLGDFNVWGFVFYNDTRTGLPVVDHCVATFGRTVQVERDFIGHQSRRIMLVGNEIVHEMLPYPFLGSERHILAAQFIEDRCPTVSLCYFYGILWKI